MKGYLILENGMIFEGNSIGAEKEVISEIVFNTSMTGYLEVLTDPSYAGQAVVMTYPLIGNYGICKSDMESDKPWPDAFIVRELSRLASNFRNECSIQDFLAENGIPGLSGIDTRALVKVLRENGTMNGMITTNLSRNMDETICKIKEYSVCGVVKKVSKKSVQQYVPGDLGTKKDIEVKRHVAVLDVGTKNNIIRSLLKRNCKVTVFPCDTKASDIIAAAPDGIMITNGPGDPKECVDIIAEIKKLYNSGIPVFAICLGHQLMALASGADTHKMKYGHRGANHPVKDIMTNMVYISSQNHGYVVDEGSLDSSVCVPAFVNVNDGTIEGLRYVNRDIFTVQFHPEACAGPKDSEVLFERFINMMEEKKNA